MPNPVKALDISSATARVAPDLLIAPAILSDKTFRRSTVHQEDLKQYWESILEINKSTLEILVYLVMTIAHLNSTKSELRFCTNSNPARYALEILNGEDLWQWSRKSGNKVKCLSSVNHTTEKSLLNHRKKKTNRAVVFSCRPLPNTLKYKNHQCDLPTILKTRLHQTLIEEFS